MRTFFFVFLLVGVCFAETFVRLRLRRTEEDDDRFTVQAYAGHPERILALTVAFAVPSAFHSEALWNESATQGDLPGLYATLYLSSHDPLVHELAPLDGPPGALLSLPRLRLRSLGTTHTWNVNALVPQPALELGTAFSNRGLFLLGPGSAAWLKARYARFTRNELQLRDAIDLTDDYHALPCRGRDAQGRCILERDTYTLRIEKREDGKIHDIVVHAPGQRVILDLDSYTTLLSHQVSSRLRGTDLKKSSARRIDWVPSQGGPAWLLARTEDLTPEALQSNSEVKRSTYATSEDEGDGDIIIGRELALRLFAEMVYDSNEATWYVRAADVSERYGLVIRWIIAVSLVLQALLIGRQLLNPDQVDATNLLESLYSGPPRSLQGPPLLHWAYSLAVAATTTVQLVLGQVYIGSGADVDLVRLSPLRAVGITLSVAAALFALTHFALIVIMKKERQLHTLNTYFIASESYILLGLCGLVGALLPRASRGTSELVLLAALLALIVFFMALVVFMSVQVIIRRLMFKASEGNRTLFQQQTLLWVGVALALTALSLALIFTGGDLVFDESVAILTVKSSAASAALLAQALLLGVVVICVIVLQFKILDVDLRQFHALTATKSD